MDFALKQIVLAVGFLLGVVAVAHYIWHLTPMYPERMKSRFKLFHLSLMAIFGGYFLVLILIAGKIVSCRFVVPIEVSSI